MQRAAALRRAQRMVEADVLITEARALDPDDRLIAFLHAQSRYELGHPAAELFAAARAMWPDNPDVVRNHALALASEGRATEGEALLAATVRAQPDWLDGHRVLASLRRTHGSTTSDDASYAEACSAQAGLPVWLAWFGHAAQRKDWDAARVILDRARAALGAAPQLDAARTVIVCEAGEVDARDWIDRTAGQGDPQLAIARARFALGNRQADVAEAALLPLLATPAAGQAWPYLALAWRMKGDAKAAWLEGDPRFTSVLDVGLAGEELADLAALLRRLHTADAPYPDQSVRGGTQTDRSVLLRHEAALQGARSRLMDAVTAFVAHLPAPDPRHPLLGRPRTDLRIAGSWSVRLTGGGRNVPHTHPMGWLSSAFYVALPDGDTGALTLGTPPDELGLDLPPLRTIEPEVGTLVLFPSTMWHATRPFASGERLNIAFDIAPAA